MALHDGHRARLRNRFVNEGLEHFQEINVLEILLFHCIPRVDTNPIAHRLLDEFGSLTNVLEASVEDLQKVEGIGENSAIFLSLVNATNRYYMTKKAEVKGPIERPEQYISYLAPRFIGRKNETVFILCMDSQRKIICCKQLSEGTVLSVNTPIRKIVEAAITSNATYAVLAHNHPDGSVLPSNSDYRTTERVAKSLAEVEVCLLDHVIFSDTDHVSMKLSSDYSFPDNGAFI